MEVSKNNLKAKSFNQQVFVSSTT